MAFFLGNSMMHIWVCPIISTRGGTHAPKPTKHGMVTLSGEINHVTLSRGRMYSINIQNQHAHAYVKHICRIMYTSLYVCMYYFYPHILLLGLQALV